MKKTFVAAVVALACSCASAGNLVVSVLDREGKPVIDAVVVILPANKNVLPKKPLPVQTTVAQEKMQFIPAVSLVPVGAKVQFVNNDSWDHQVRSSPAGMGQFNATNAGFELRLEGKTDGKPARAAEVTLDKAGILGATLMGCFIHGSMRGYVYASESPWAAKTNADGLAIFKDLPTGAAQVKVWQADQLVDVLLQTTTVGDTQANTVIQLSVVPRRRRGAV